MAPTDPPRARDDAPDALAPRDDSPATEPRARSPRGTWPGIAAAVVAILVAVGIGAMVVSDDAASNQAHRGGSTPAVAGRAPAGDLGDLGDVRDPAALRALLEGRDPAARRGRTGGESAAPGLRASADAADESTAEVTVDPETCAAQLAGSRPVRFVGTGIYGGLPVVVVGLDQGGRTIAFVVSGGDCSTVLTSVSR